MAGAPGQKSPDPEGQGKAHLLGGPFLAQTLRELIPEFDEHGQSPPSVGFSGISSAPQSGQNSRWPFWRSLRRKSQPSDGQTITVLAAISGGPPGGAI